MILGLFFPRSDVTVTLPLSLSRSFSCIFAQCKLERSRALVSAFRRACKRQLMVGAKGQFRLPRYNATFPSDRKSIVLLLLR